MNLKAVSILPQKKSIAEATVFCY